MELALALVFNEVKCETIIIDLNIENDALVVQAQTIFPCVVIAVTREIEGVVLESHIKQAQVHMEASMTSEVNHGANVPIWLSLVLPIISIIAFFSIFLFFLDKLIEHR